ncbi:MAG: hypothetical protein LWX83_16040 [Anaerolineae bacterium]|nr:hypothetical protein [Anaerolineae bacterium]
MKSGWEEHKGKKIFIARYDHMTLQEVRAEVNEVKRNMTLGSADKTLLVLVDTTGTIVSPEVLNLYKEVSAASGQLQTRTAIIGMSGPRRSFLEIVSKFSKSKVVPFDEVQKAKDWLVS